jgi:hypothetical protein
LSQLQYTQTFQNVFHIFDGETPFVPLTIKGLVETYWINVVKPYQLSSLSYRLIQLRQVDVLGQPTYNYAINITASGGSAIETWGPLSQLYSFHTLTAGPRGRGRTYLAGQYGGDVVANQWSSARFTAMTTLAAALTTRWVGATPTSGMNLVVCGRESLPTPHFVTEIVPQPIPGVQRRRNYGVGI